MLRPANLGPKGVSLLEGEAMKNLVIASLLLLSVSASGLAESLNGDTVLEGFNPRTGLQWRLTIHTKGDLFGVDSHGTAWARDEDTGVYLTSKGHGCMGDGTTRPCW
jgi:hypothetical protein